MSETERITEAVKLLHDAVSRLYPGLGAHAKILGAIELLTGKKYRVKNILISGELEEVK